MDISKARMYADVWGIKRMLGLISNHLVKGRIACEMREGSDVVLDSLQWWGEALHASNVFLCTFPLVEVAAGTSNKRTERTREQRGGGKERERERERD